MPSRPCGREVFAGGELVDTGRAGGTQRQCAYPRMKGKQQCQWHWLAKQPADVQAAYAARRLNAQAGKPERARVPSSEWPDGERWCAGCQSFVPLFYTSGSRCKACQSSANHERAVQKIYDLEPGEYDALFKLQGGRCFICQRKPRTKRLAVDHDHETGRVRGLLCANNENGCNRGVVANLEAAHDGGLKAARRAVLYLEMTPYERLKSGSTLTWAEYVAREAQRAVAGAQEPSVGTPGPPPPF